MKEYTTSNIRNVAVVGHGKTGKTSLLEAVLFNSGANKRLGKVDDGYLFIRCHIVDRTVKSRIRGG